MISECLVLILITVFIVGAFFLDKKTWNELKDKEKE